MVWWPWVVLLAVLLVLAYGIIDGITMLIYIALALFIVLLISFLIARIIRF